MNGHIKIFNDSIVGHKTKIWYVSKTGEETDISDVVTEVTFHLSVGEINSATLKVIKVAGEGFVAPWMVEVEAA